MARRLQLSDSRAIESALRNSHRGATPYSMQVHSSTTPTASRPSESYYFTWGTTVQKHSLFSLRVYTTSMSLTAPIVLQGRRKGRREAHVRRVMRMMRWRYETRQK